MKAPNLQKVAVVTSIGIGLCGACTIVPDQTPPPAMGPPQNYAPGYGATTPGTPAYGGGPIEAGCSFNAGNLQGDVGAMFQVSCPSGCESQGGGLWGSGPYTADSGICRAGIHAGAISPAGGVVTVWIGPGQLAYRGSMRNGLSSSDYGSYPRSFTVAGPGGPPAAAATAPAPPGYPPPPPPTPAGYMPGAPPVIEAGCSYNAGQIQDAIGTAHVISCPPGCSAVGGLWGTDQYTADSAICRAAIHAGFINDAGGTVTVVLDPGRPAYRGSRRNGLQSSDYGSYPKSYHLQRP